MLEVCRRSLATGVRHYLYGGKPGIAPLLAENLRQWMPGIQIVGTFTPPFRPLNGAELRALHSDMANTRPDIVWVGLSTPKQERFMAANFRALPCTLMIGVGAAFDIHTGQIKDAPRWIKDAGLQWAHRLRQEPSRLWRRYLINNSSFLIALAGQLAGLRRYSLPPSLGETPRRC